MISVEELSQSYEIRKKTRLTNNICQDQLLRKTEMQYHLYVFSTTTEIKVNFTGCFPKLKRDFGFFFSKKRGCCC